jgi:tetratricopeptide (TPR) repeat protein
MLVTLFVAGTVMVAVPVTYLALKDYPPVRALQSALVQETGKLLGKLPNHQTQGQAESNLSAPLGAVGGVSAVGQGLQTGGQKPTTSEEMRIVDQAVAQLQSGLEKDPSNTTLHNRLGMIYAEIGEMPEAEAQFKQAILLSRAKLSELYTKIQVKRLEGDLAAASAMMLNVSSIQLDLSSAHSNLARVYEKLGDSQRVVKQLDELNRDVVIGGGLASGTIKASDKSDKPAKANPEVVAGLARAEALMQVGRMLDAGRELRTLLAVAPDLAEAHELLGKTGIATNNFFLARREFEEAARLEPTKAAYFSSLGFIYDRSGKKAKAMEAYQQAYKLEPKNAVNAFNLGNAYAANNQNSQATNYFKQAIELNPNLASAHNNLASMYSMAGNYEAAIKQFEQAIYLAPQMASAHYGLGLAMYNLKDYAGAAMSFKQACLLNPNLIDAQAKLQVCQRKATRSL